MSSRASSPVRARTEQQTLIRILDSMGCAPCAASTGRAQGDQDRRLCARCPARAACLAYAIAADEPAGVWGGYTVEERRHRFPSPVVARPAISSRLRDLRVSCGIGQAELARRVGVSRGFLANIEAGRRALSSHIRSVPTASGQRTQDSPSRKGTF